MRLITKVWDKLLGKLRTVPFATTVCVFKICVLHLSPNTVFALVPLVSCVKEFPVVRVTVAPSTTCLITVASLVKPSLNNDLFAGAVFT